MYLKELDLDQKSAFFQLANEIIKADGIVMTSESKMMTEYQIEMGVAIRTEYTHEQSVEILNRADLSIRKKLLFELIGLALADTMVQKEEYSILEKLSQEINIPLEYYFRAVEQIKEYLLLLNRINEDIYAV